MIKILFVCHGNICRSTMAQSVFTHMVHQKGLSSYFVIESAATSREEIGNPPHHGTVDKLRQVGIPLVPHRAVQMTRQDYEQYDYLIGMDSANIRNMTRIAEGDPDGKIYKLTYFSGQQGDIADPWYTGNFEDTYRDVLAGCEGLLAYLETQGGADLWT
jgi:protein-tyrosine phosphatase